MGSEFTGSGEFDEMAERFLTWLRRHLPAVSVGEDSDHLTLAMRYLASAEQLDDRGALAVARAFTSLLGYTVDITNPAFRNAAVAVQKTRALARDLRDWRASDEIRSVIDDVLRHHRDAASLDPARQGEGDRRDGYQAQP